jgi:hypothetical protein
MSNIQQREFTRRRRVEVLLLLLWWCGVTTSLLQAAPTNKGATAQGVSSLPRLPDQLLLPASPVPASGPARLLPEADWKILEPAEIWREYGLIDLTIRRYMMASVPLQVELFTMRSAAGAYGLQTFYRASTREASPKTQSIFSVGPYVVRLSAGGDLTGTPTPEWKLMEESIRSALGSPQGELPVLPEHLPTRDRLPNSETYYLGPRALSEHPRFGPLATTLDFSSLPEMMTASFNQEGGGAPLDLFLIEFLTPQTASDALSQLTTYVEGLSKDSRPNHEVRRIGNYLAVIAGETAPTNANRIFGEIRYEQKVYWHGQGISNIPLEFRPYDPTTWREMTNTTTVVVQSLLWIAILLGLTILIGMFVGSLVFYWRRYQRRKRGLDNLFSDSGETIFLNLEDYLLSPPPPQTALAPLPPAPEEEERRAR